MISDIRAGLKSFLNSDVAMTVVLFVLGVIFVITANSVLVEGHNWGDDFGAYLHLARNITEGRPWLDRYSGIEAPPGFPIILSAWTQLFGDSFVSLKRLNVLSWFGTGIITYFLSREVMKPLSSLIAACLVFVTPFYFILQQSVGTDIPAAFTFVLSTYFLVCYCRVFETSGAPIALRNIAWHFLMLGSFYIFITLLIRPAAISLAIGAVAGILFTMVFRRWRYSLILIPKERPALHRSATPTQTDWVAMVSGVAAIVVTLILYMMFFGNSSEGHLSNASGAAWLDLTPARLFESIKSEITHWRLLLFAYPVRPWEQYAVASILGVSMLVYVLRSRELIIPMVTLATIFMLTLLPWDHSPRLSLQIIPFFLIMFVYCVGSCVDGIYKVTDTKIFRGFAVALAAVALGFTAYAMSERSEWARTFSDEELSRPEVGEVMAWLRDNTGETERACSFKPRAFMYLTDRPACWLNPFNIESPLAPSIIALGGDLAILVRDERMQPQFQAAEAIQSDLSVTVVFENDLFVVVRPVTIE